MIFSLVAMTGLEKCCITSAYLQWLCHSGERPVARGPLVCTQSCHNKYTKVIGVSIGEMSSSSCQIIFQFSFLLLHHACNQLIRHTGNRFHLAATEDSHLAT